MKKIKELLNKKSVYYVCLFILVFALHLFMKPGKADDSWFINNYTGNHFLLLICAICNGLVDFL